MTLARGYLLHFSTLSRVERRREVRATKIWVAPLPRCSPGGLYGCQEGAYARPLWALTPPLEGRGAKPSNFGVRQFQRL